MISLATRLVYKYESELDANSKLPNNGMNDKVTDDVIESLSEDFLDGVFGSSSKITRQEYIEKVANEQNWIFNSKEIRDRVNKKI